jgi:hypothetical protein
MYRIKAAGNYNIILKDIGVFFSFPSEVFITEQQYKKSRDLMSCFAAGYVLIDRLKDAPTQVEVISEKIVPASDTFFVTEGNKVFTESSSFVKKTEEDRVTIVQEVKHAEKQEDTVSVVDLLQAEEIIDNQEVTLSEDKAIDLIEEVKQIEDVVVLSVDTIEVEESKIDIALSSVKNESIKEVKAFKSLNKKEDSDSKKNSGTISKKKFGKK